MTMSDVGSVGVDYGGGLVVEYCPDGGMFEL